MQVQINTTTEVPLYLLDISDDDLRNISDEFLNRPDVQITSRILDDDGQFVVENDEGIREFSRTQSMWARIQDQENRMRARDQEREGLLRDFDRVAEQATASQQSHLRAVLRLDELQQQNDSLNQGTLRHQKENGRLEKERAELLRTNRKLERQNRGLRASNSVLLEDADTSTRIRVRLLEDQAELRATSVPDHRDETTPTSGAADEVGQHICTHARRIDE